MKLLSGHSLTPARYVAAVEMSLQLKERDSSATMTPADTDGISIGSWLQDDRDPGNGIVWRVRSITQAYDTRTPQIQLEHAVATLKDGILFGEHKPAQITGNAGATTCTAKQAIQYILSFQSDWALGTFDYSSVSNPYKFDGDTLFDAIETVSDSLEDAWWSYDFSTYPFKLNIRQKSADIESEMRAGRNLKTIRKTIDKSGMYTRFYPIGKDDLHIDSQYVQKNTNLYGVVSKVETDNSIDSKAELTRWANERLDRHAEPTVTIDVEGVELAEATGEELDSLELGTVCRIPLPEFGTTIQERIVSINYSDKIRQPQAVKIQLANTRNDVTKIIANAIKKSGKGSRTSSKKGKEDKAWFEDTNDHVAMCAKGIVGVDAQGNPNWTRMSQIIADENGIDSTVTEVRNGVQTAMSEISQTEDRIMLAVDNVEDGLHSEITQTASEIQLLVQSELDDFYTQIIQEASQVVIRTGDNTKTFKSNTAPTGTQQDPLVDGDVWFKGDGEFTWGEASGKTWLEDAGKTWADALTSEAYRYNGTTNLWEKVIDAKGLLQDTRFEENKQAIRLMAGRVDVVNEQAHAYYAELKVEADQITSTVNDYYNGLSSSITQTAGEIRQEVTDSVNGLQGSITVNANKIALVVDSNNNIKPASIVAAINNGSSSVVISANHINLDGYVKASDITTDFLSARISNFSSLSSERGGISAYSIGTTNFTQGGVSCYLPNAVAYLQITQSGNTYTLQRKRFNDDNWVDVGSFSRATSLSGSWSGNTYTVSASPQGNTNSVSPFAQHIIPQGQPGTSMNTYVATSKASAPYYDTHGSSKPLYLIRDGGYVKIRDANSTSGGNTYAQIQAGCTDISLDGWTDTYSGNSSKRYTILSGSGSSAVLAMSFKVKSNDGYEEEQVWNNADGNGANKAVTMAYRDGYAAGGGGTTYYSRSLRCTSVEQTYPGSATNYYYFRLEGNYSFNAGSNYTFYRTGWS